MGTQQAESAGMRFVNIPEAMVSSTNEQVAHSFRYSKITTTKFSSTAASATIAPAFSSPPIAWLTITGLPTRPLRKCISSFQRLLASRHEVLYQDFPSKLKLPGLAPFEKSM